MSNIAERIERIPFSRFHWQLLFIGGLGYTFDGLDAAVTLSSFQCCGPAGT